MASGTRRRPRPKVFVGSSVEGLDVAYAIQENLQRDGEVTVWPQGVFELSKTTMQSLIEELGRSDFGVFVLTPDDRIRLRKRVHSAIRDNVVFELGLFTGRLGPGRTFAVRPDGADDLRLPTDLTGVTLGVYDARRSDKNLQAALGPFCNQVRRALQKHRPRRPRMAKARIRKPVSRLRHLTIHSALYGVPHHRIDVKAALVKELQGEAAALIGNHLGGDPRRGVAKTLQLDFSFRGKREEVEIPEGSTLAFPD